MYRLLERIPASPEHARRPARASANERPFIRGETGWGSLWKARWSQPPAVICWEASDQHGNARSRIGRCGSLCMGGMRPDRARIGL